jgi:putative ABC transport system substrate-binding protein
MQFDRLRRRDFVVLLGGGAAAWPLAARAQQADRMRRIGVLMGYGETDPEAKALLSEFTQGLSELGWSDGRNARIDVRWAAGSIERMQTLAKELVDLRPDVILANTTPVTAALQRATQAIPIVFVIVADPIGSGFVASLARPGGNITGFVNEEASTAGKRLELLTVIAPAVKRVAILFNPDTAADGGSYYLPAFEAAARSHQVESITGAVRSNTEIEAVVASLGREPRGGLVVMNDGFMFVHRAEIIMAADKSKVPTIYYDTIFAKDGGLLAYGTDRGDIFRRAAPYVDRVLRGAKPTELPVQLPAKFEMALNAKTAKALGLTVPESILAIANEVIE